MHEPHQNLTLIDKLLTEAGERYKKAEKNKNPRLYSLLRHRLDNLRLLHYTWSIDEGRRRREVLENPEDVWRGSKAEALFLSNLGVKTEEEAPKDMFPELMRKFEEMLKRERELANTLADVKEEPFDDLGGEGGEGEPPPSPPPPPGGGWWPFRRRKEPPPPPPPLEEEEDEREELARQLKEAEEGRERLVSELKEREDERKKLATELEEVRAENRKLQGDFELIGGGEKDVSVLMAEQRYAEDHLKEIRKLEREKKSLQEKLEREKEVNQQKQQALKESEASWGEVRDASEEFKAENRRLGARIKQLESQIRGMEETAAARPDEEDLEGRLRQATEREEELRTGLREAEEREEDLRRRLEEAEEGARQLAVRSREA